MSGVSTNIVVHGDYVVIAEVGNSFATFLETMIFRIHKPLATIIDLSPRFETGWYLYSVTVVDSSQNATKCHFLFKQY